MSEKKEEILKNPVNITQPAQHVSHNDEKGWTDGWAPSQPAVGRRMLTFPDDTQVGLMGLDDTMAELYAEGREATDETAEEIINRLEARKNYIPASERVHKEYAYLLLKEYKAYVKDRSGSGP